MGRYHYTKAEKELNKVLKYQQSELSDMDMQIAEVNSSCSARICLLYTSPSPRDGLLSRMPSSA